MMRRRAIEGFVGGVLLLLVVGGTGVDPASAADTKVPPPAVATARPAGAKASAATAPGAVSVAAPAVPAVPAAPAAPAPAAAPAAVVPAAPPAYSYSPAGKSDPFQPFVEVDLAVKKEKEKRAKEEELRKASKGKRPISPLQQAEISKFRLIGIAGDDKQRMAIVKDDAAKKSYPLVVGTHIGLNGGRVVSIMSDRLIVEEPLSQDPENPQKRKQTRKITVLLHKEEERKP
ncbi:MAG: pilus assembly protein PilP [Syntrophales bacterium]